jgi:hypothetical protein
MGGTTVVRGLMAAGTAAVMLAAPVGLMAQGATAEENPARQQAFIFERALRGAVELGGQQLAKQALVVAPELRLWTEEAIVRGVKLDAYGFYFDVQAPSIQRSAMLLDMMQRSRPSARPSRQVSAAGTVEPDPMVSAPSAFDPDREYTVNVRAAVMDAMIDSSGVLNLAPSERLTVVVSGIDYPDPNPLYRSNPNKLILRISGADLAEFRQGRLSREQAKERIVEERF